MNLDGTQPTFLTARCLIRPFTPLDIDALVREAGRREIAQTTLRIPHPYTQTHAHDFLAICASTWSDKKGAMFAIIDRATDSLAGGVGLSFDAPHRHAELGYWIAVDFWSKGFATEAATRVMDWAFGEVGLHRIHAHAFGNNPASSRVLAKLGMTHEGTLRQHIVKWDHVQDAILYGVLREEWQSRKAD